MEAAHVSANIATRRHINMNMVVTALQINGCRTRRFTAAVVLFAVEGIRCAGWAVAPLTNIEAANCRLTKGNTVTPRLVCFVEVD